MLRKLSNNVFSNVFPSDVETLHLTGGSRVGAYKLTMFRRKDVAERGFDEVTYRPTLYKYVILFPVF